MNTFHIPVMVSETIDLLHVQKGMWYIDANLGGGGHTGEILKRGGKVIGIDLDKEAIEEVCKKFNLELKMENGKLMGVSENLIVVQENFVHIKEVVDQLIKEGVISTNEMRRDLSSSTRDDSNFISGVLFDLGISSHQLETGERGFSFQSEALLDMRMNQTSEQPTAADLVNGLHEKELAELFWKLGEESFSRPVARKIAQERQKRPIKTTKQLADIVSSAKRKEGKIHPATKVFQALRIAVNDELNSLQDALPQALDVLDYGGRIVVISFHSLEDRIVKNTFKDWEDEGKVKILTEKPLEPTEEEVMKNPRSRSAKVRAVERMYNE